MFAPRYSANDYSDCRAPLAIQSYLAGSSCTTIVASLTCARRKLTLRITLHLIRENRVIRGSISSMATIAVVCPSCHARFQVSEKFAGKEGPCPKCKQKITVPALGEEVKIHGPEEYEGAKDAKGHS